MRSLPLRIASLTPDHQPRSPSAFRAAQPLAEYAGGNVASLRDDRRDVDASIVPAALLIAAVGPRCPFWPSEVDISAAIGMIAPSGKIDERTLAAGQSVFGIEGIPLTGGRDARQKMQRGIEGILRAMTGAAAPDSEVARYMNMFFPSPMDDDKTALDKLTKGQTWASEIVERMKVGRPQLQAPSGGDDYESMYGLKKTGS